jgi:hypothetical protein
MAEKGILTSDQEKALATMLDDAIKLNGFLELIDGYVFKALITFVDDKYLDQLQVDVKTKLAELASAVIAKDVDKAEELATEVMVLLIKIPGLDTDSEGLLFKGIIEVVVGAVINWINGQKGTKVTLKLGK